MMTFVSTLPWLHVNTRTRQIVNEDGAEVILHGVNVVYKVPPYLPMRDNFDIRKSLSLNDFDQLWKWGFNVVRLGVMWPGLHPREGYTDTSYLDKIAGIVNDLAAYNIYTVLDLHQDLLSRYYCGEGAPDWLIKPLIPPHKFPWPLFKEYELDEHGYPKIEQCLSAANFGEYYLTEAINNAFDQLYIKGTPLNADLHKFWNEVAWKFKDNPAVMGYELINEPIAGNLYKRTLEWLNPFGAAGKNYMEPLYASLHESIRKIDNKHIILFEGAMNNMFFTNGMSQAPGGPEYNDRNVLSHHLYCGYVTPDGCPNSHFMCEVLDNWFMTTKMLEIERFGCGGLITEFGALCEKDDCITELHRFLDKAYSHKQGWIYWQYKQFEDLTTANRDETEGFYDLKTGKLMEKKVKALTRPIARVVAGQIQKMKFELETSKFTLTYKVDGNVMAKTTEIYSNLEYYNGAPPTVKVNNPNVEIHTNIIENSFIIIKATHKEGVKHDDIIEIQVTKP